MTTDNSERCIRPRRANLIRLGLIAVAIMGGLALAGFIVLQGTTSTVKLADGVYWIQSKSLLFPDGSNSLAVATPNGVLLVDTQLPSWTERVKNEVQEIFGRPASIVVNTHWHTDHSGGNDRLTGTAVILAHENVLKTLSNPHEGFGLTGPGSHHTYDARAVTGLPEQIYEKFLDLPSHDDGASVRAVHYANAHTDGDTVVYVGQQGNQAGIIAVGDIVWPGAFPFVDIRNGGSAPGILAAIDDILIQSSGGSLILAGHREPIMVSELLSYREMVSDTIQTVREAMNEGAELETIIAKGLPEKYRKFASSVVPQKTWITMIYKSLQAETAVGN